MLKRFDWAPRCGVLGLLFIFLPPTDLNAQRHAPPGQRGTQEKDAPLQGAVTLPDSITVPDGTPLTLRLLSELSSETAKVGDIVELTIPYPLRIDGLVVVPKGTAVRGTVLQVSHPHRPSKNGQLRMAVEKVVLPSGEIAALRPSKSASGKAGKMAARHEQGDLGVLNWVFAPVDPIFPILLPLALATKGHELVYPTGTQTMVYINGPLSLDRGALLRLQPPPYSYKGPAQVFFNSIDERYGNELFCGKGQVHVGDLSVPLRLELTPGTYSFSLLNIRRNVQVEVREDHQYWIQLERGGLVVKDPQQHQTEFDIVQNAFRLTNKDFTSLPPQDSCPNVARP